MPPNWYSLTRLPGVKYRSKALCPMIFSGVSAGSNECEVTMRFLIGTLIFASIVSGQTVNAPSDQVRTVIGRLELDRFKAHIKGLAQFGDRLQGTARNRDAIDWLEKQLKAFGYTNVE